ncbi:adenylate cyclase, partial [Cladochytrium tenue]
ATWKGEDPTLPGIILNSHYDVVPVLIEHWEHDPFDAKVLEDGRIYGRGAQDMKSVCIQYVEAIHRLQASGFVPKRNVHLLYVPDEEIGGAQGMSTFIDSPQFKAIQPVAFALDEGLANPGDAYTVFYGERAIWWLYVTAKGPTGHGSRFIKDTAVSKIIDICNKAQAFRDEQERALDAHDGCKHGEMKKRKLGDVTTINITALKAGVPIGDAGGKDFALNVIPTEALAGFDVRISPSLDIAAFEAKLDEWCAAEGVSWEFSPITNPLREHSVTSLDEDRNVWWRLFRQACEGIGANLETEVFPAATDSRFLRRAGVPAIGFSPMNRSPVLLHEHNESLHKDVFLRGIEVFEAIFREMFSHSEGMAAVGGDGVGTRPVNDPAAQGSRTSATTTTDEVAVNAAAAAQWSAVEHNSRVTGDRGGSGSGSGSDRFFGAADAFPESLYILPADADEKTRLHLQHIVLRSIFGTNFHTPQKELFMDKNKGAKILDVGCGTGSWCLDMAKQFPDVSVTGVIGWNGPLGQLFASDTRKLFYAAKPFLLNALEVTEDSFAQLVDDAIDQCGKELIYGKSYVAFGRVQK